MLWLEASQVCELRSHRPASAGGAEVPMQARLNCALVCASHACRRRDALYDLPLFGSSWGGSARMWPLC